MLVTENEAKFEELFKFSCYLRHTHEETWKATHFERELQAEFREKVATLEIKKFTPLK